MRSVIRGKTWEGRCGFGRGAKNQRQEGILSWQTAVSIDHTSVLARADFFHTCEYIHLQLATLTSWRPLIFLGKKISGSGKWGGSEILDWWDYRRNRIIFNFVCLFLPTRGSRSYSRWLPGTNPLTSLPIEIPTGVPWESRREFEKILVYTPEGNDIKELVFFVL